MGIETLAIASLATGILGAVTGAVGSIAEAGANKRQAEYNAAVANNNKIIAEREAKYAATVAAQQETEEVYKVRQALGEQVATQSASGLDVSTGSNALVTSSLRGMGLRSIRNVRDTARRDPYALQLQADQFGTDAKAYKAQAKASMLAGYLGAGGNLLAGASSVGNSFFDMARTGVVFDGVELTS